MNIKQDVLWLLENERLCFLGTSYDKQPHVSLMNFTYLSKERLIILSSRKDTSKVRNIQTNPNVSILIYTLVDRRKEPISCSFTGRASILEPVEDSFYRNIHYSRNSERGNFIIGEGIVIMAVKIDYIYISDAYDKVWEFPVSKLLQ